MRYSKLIWNHSFPDEPTEIYSEHDDSGWERRKIEMYRNGSMAFASATESSGGTELSLIRCPPDKEVNSEPEFQVLDVTKEEFEDLWTKARQLARSA